MYLLPSVKVQSQEINTPPPQYTEYIGSNTYLVPSVKVQSQEINNFCIIFDIIYLERKSSH